MALVVKLRDIDLVEGLQLEGSLTTHELDLPLEGTQGWELVHYRLDLRILDKECLATGTLRSEFHMPCARCLEPRSISIDVPNFAVSYETAGLESIDLTAQVREDILLGLPLAPRCELDAEFRCPQTGEIHRGGDYGFAELKREEVWGKLEELTKKDKESHGSSQT